MTITAAILLVATGSVGATSPPVPRAVPLPTEWADLVIRQQTIIRMPVHHDKDSAKLAKPERWVEKDKAKCLAVDNVGGAIRSGDDSIDLVVRGGDRWRVRFSDECPALDFYQGFYFKPDAEHKLCARRDVVYARSGGECRIWSIRKLELKTKR